MCEEESDDPEAVNKLLEINDSIHRTIERYKLVKKGDHEAASRIPKGTLGTTTGVSKNANNELSLIDFDPEPSSNGNASQAAAGGSSLENDLLGLSIDEPAPMGGGISLGPCKWITGESSSGSEVLNCLSLTYVISSQPSSGLCHATRPTGSRRVPTQLRYSVLVELIATYFAVTVAGPLPD